MSVCLCLAGLLLGFLSVSDVRGAELSGLSVCADPDNLPFSSKNLTTPGFEVELARALASHVTFHWVPTYRWVFVARQLLDGRCDLFFGLPLDPRFVDDNPRITLSRPYYVMGQVLVSRIGEGVRRLEDLKGRMIGVQAMTPGDILVFQRGYSRRMYFTPEETFEAVRGRQVDAAVMWSSLAGWLAKKNPGIELTWIRDPEGEFKVAVGLRKADRELKAAVDRAIARLLDEKKVEAILSRYGIPIPTETPPAVPREGAPVRR
jgi:ABC-type amino acid transport substrate-binding protein